MTPCPDTALNTTTRLVLFGGVLLAALADANASSALNLARFGMIGAWSLADDEFSWLELAYGTAKYAGFLLAPWLWSQGSPVRNLRWLCWLMALTCLPFFWITNLNALITLRALHGFCGGAALILAQAVIFQIFSPDRQPMAQACFATAAVVAPGMFLPLLHGALTEHLAWQWVWTLPALCGLLASALLVCVPSDAMRAETKRGFDLPGLLLALLCAACLTFLSQRSSRWNWNQDMLALAVIGFGALLLLVFWHRGNTEHQLNRLVHTSVFVSADTCFGLLICLTMAGGTLFCSNALLGSLTLGALGFTPTLVGQTHFLPGLIFVVALFFAAILIQCCKLPTLTPIPLGVGCILGSMWLLAKTSGESGLTDMLPGLLVRAFGLGCLLLPVTILTLNSLKGDINVQGVALFSTFRQTGGLFFSTLLQWYLDQRTALARSSLISHLGEGDPLLDARLQAMQAALHGRGLDSLDAARAAVGALKKTLEGQAAVIAVDNCFLAVCAGMLCLMPLLGMMKIFLSKIKPQEQP